MMLDGSPVPRDIYQEEWVKLWLSKLTPAQRALVIDVLKELQHRQQRRSSGSSLSQDTGHDASSLLPKL
jgi:hypothetical protein